MFVLIFCLLAFSLTNASPLEEFEQALKDTGLTFEDLFTSADHVGSVVENTINQAGPIISEIPGQIINIPADLALHREPDLYFNAQQMVEYRGFKFEAHHVVTEDCQILEIHRVLQFDQTPNKPPVLLLPGMNQDSTSWMINSIGGNVNDTDDRNLAFALAKRGFDVWMGNVRGSRYSKNHTIFSTSDPEFWKFNFDNHAFQGERNRALQKNLFKR